MSYLAKLFLENTERYILNADILIQQATDWVGRPSMQPQGGLISIRIKSTHETLFWDWTVSPTMMKNGYIRFYKHDGMSKFADLEFWDCYCIDYYETYDDKSTEALDLHLTLSAGITRFKDVVFEKNWKITDLSLVGGDAISFMDTQQEVDNDGDTEIEVFNLKWKSENQVASKALVGDTITLTADTRNASEGDEISFDIYDKDKENEDDYVTSVSGKVTEGKVSIDWKVTWVADDDDTDSEEEQEAQGYTMPEYYFFSKDYGGSENSSGLLDIKGWIDLQIKDANNITLVNTDLIMIKPDGEHESVTTDEEGFLKKSNIDLGNYQFIVDRREDIEIKNVVPEDEDDKDESKENLVDDTDDNDWV